MLRPLRLPALLVGDPRLGGISATLSAYESLLLRGYDVDAILLMDPHDSTLTVPSIAEQLAGATQQGGGAVVPAAGLGNATALRSHFATQVGAVTTALRAMRTVCFGGGASVWALRQARGHTPAMRCTAAAQRGHESRSTRATGRQGAPLFLPLVMVSCVAHVHAQVHRLGGPPVVVLSVPGCQPASAEQAAEAAQHGGLDANLRHWLQVGPGRPAMNEGSTLWTLLLALGGVGRGTPGQTGVLGQRTVRPCLPRTCVRALVPGRGGGPCGLTAAAWWAGAHAL